MPFIKYVGSGGRLPFGIPTVQRDPVTGRWAKLSDEVKTMFLDAAADAINDFTEEIAKDSMVEVPKEDLELLESIRYPGNDFMTRATSHDPLNPSYMEAEIRYEAAYAAAQHEGMAVMLHKHPIIPGAQGFFEKTSEDRPVEVFWKVEHYTTPGTKDHYLSDPYKRHLPEMEGYVAARVKEVFG